MIHDFLISENYSIFPDLPVEIDPVHAISKSDFAFHFNEKAPARYGFMPRNSKNPSDVIWIDTPTHQVYHYANAWEEKNEKGETLVITYGCVHYEF